MSQSQNDLKQLAVDLYNIKAIKFGEFTTKVGLSTPIYIDLRVIVSHPKIMKSLSNLITDFTNKELTITPDLICGVPYTALPIATMVSAATDIPMVMRRKEAKDYGTKKLIEGNYKSNDSCLIVEDVVTSGSSILETVRDLIGAGIKCTEAVVVLNREQGGEDILRENGIKMHALLGLTELMRILKEEGCVGAEEVERVGKYLECTKVERKSDERNRLTTAYELRMKHTSNPVTKQLLHIMSTKQTNLCVAADLTRTTDLLNLADQTGPFICLLKTHVDLIEDYHPNFIKHLKSIADRHDFLLFEDRKFADIGKTVELQYSRGQYRISTWAPIVTVHSVFGRGPLDGIKKAEGLDERGVFLLAEGSAEGCLTDGKYAEATVKIAEEYQSLVVGVVCQRPLFVDKLGLVQLTPGVQVGVESDGLGQRYDSPEAVVLERGADVAVVGRGITQSPEPGVAAEKYRKVLWEAYLKRVA